MEMVLPPYPSDGLPSSAARANARLRVRNIQDFQQAALQSGSELRIRESKRDERLEVRVEVSDVISTFAWAQPYPVCGASAANDGANGIGQLDLASLAAPGHAQRVEDGRRQHVARGDRQVARRVARRRFLDQVDDLEQLVVRSRLGNAVVIDVLGRNFLERDHGRRVLLFI